MRFIVAALIVCGMCRAEAAADSADSATRSILVTLADRAPTIDGRLDESMWQTAARIEDFHQIRPGDGTPPSERTVVYLAYDKDAIYVGARMWDSGAPAEVTRNVLRQGLSLMDDDRIAVLLDPFNSRRGGYRFEVNANGVRNDMLYQNGQPQSDWSVIWDAAAMLDGDGWTAEFAIPFKSLPIDPDSDTWGFNVSRAIRRKGEEVLWVSRNREWNSSIVGEAQGLRGIDQGAGLDIVPGLALKYRDDPIAGSESTTANPSFDLYYRITPSLTGSLTVNTDFSATEVDTRQVNLTRFDLFFPEKRDFFLNDADLFDFGRIGRENPGGPPPAANSQNGRPFFSRRIGLSPAGTPIDIEYGGKLSGRLGQWTVGTLAVRQDEFQTPDGERVAARDLFVGRATRDVLSESSIGMIATAGDPTSARATSLVGADFLYLNSRFRGDRTLEGEAWLQRSSTTGLSGQDAAFGAELRLPSSAGMQASAAVHELQKNFYPALGFANRTGIRDYALSVGYTEVFATERLQYIFSGIDSSRADAIGGGLQSQVITLRALEIDTPARDFLVLKYNFRTEVLADPFVIYQDAFRSVVVPVGRYAFEDYEVEIFTGFQRPLAATFSYLNGAFYGGRRLNLAGDVEWKPSEHFTFFVRYDWNEIALPEGDFTTRLAQVRAVVAFNSRLSWINVVQYDNLSESLGFHSRVKWQPRAGRDVTLVLNQGYEDFDRDGRFRAAGKEVALRATYTFRF